MIRLFMFLIFIILFNSSFAQQKINFSNNEIQTRIQKLESRIKKIIKKDKLNTYPKNLRFFYIIKVYYNGNASESDFITKSFLNRLYYEFFVINKISFIQSYVFISDENGDLISMTDGKYIVSLKYNNLFNKELYFKGEAVIKAYLERKIDYAFFINNTNIKYTFGLNRKNNNVVVIVSNEKDFKYLNLNEFIQCCWDKFGIQPWVLPNVVPMQAGSP